jgi:hypothetical protein
MTPEWRVPLVPDCRISIILATFDPDLLAIVVFDDNECAISARTGSPARIQERVRTRAYSLNWRFGQPLRFQAHGFGTLGLTLGIVIRHGLGAFGCAL